MLAVADIVIGVSYLSVAHGLDGHYSLIAASVHGRLRPGRRSPGRSSSPPSPATDLFYTLSGALGLFTLLVVGYLFLRPANPTGRLRPPDAAAIRQLLDKHGEQDSLGYFALRDDKSVIWSPTGKSCIGYRVLSGVMLASGDPLGDSGGLAGRDPRVPG